MGNTKDVSSSEKEKDTGWFDPFDLLGQGTKSGKRKESLNKKSAKDKMDSL
jgi:hypothetical protein